MLSSIAIIKFRIVADLALRQSSGFAFPKIENQDGRPLSKGDADLHRGIAL
jgi:hypothetical protein